MASEITDITESMGPAWTTPVQDANGNLTSVPRPRSLTNSYDLTWDAWNRLVKVTQGTTTRTLAYDGAHRCWPAVLVEDMVHPLNR